MKKNQSKGLVYRKMDLHVHTPASKCFVGKVTSTKIVKKAIKEGLRAIAITDHNTGDGIDKIKSAAKGKLVIFPGVEISATGGKDGPVHIVGIFEPSKGTKDIENLLGQLGIKASHYGKEDAVTSQAPDKVIDVITEHGGLAVLAHANSSHGVLNDMSGQPRINAVRNPNLHAAEATDFENDKKAKKKKRVVDWLNGKDSQYKRKLAVYQASDNLNDDGKHSLEGIGSRYTYFKMDEISREGLRQCFDDFEVKIKQMHEYKMQKYPKIKDIKIYEGFLKGQELSFHKGLNCLIGGKGVGKSLVVEFLRFALDQASEDSDIKKDHEGKLKKRLSNLGSVSVDIELENCEVYRVTRTFNGDDNPIVCVNLNTRESYEGEISTLFPILSYSQTEVIKIAEDEDAQLRLVDGFIDSSTFKRKIDELNEKLDDLDKKLSNSLKAKSEFESCKKYLDTVKEQLKNINKSLKNKLFDEFRKLENKKTLLQGFTDFQKDLIKNLQEAKSALLDLEMPDVPKELEKDIQVKKMISLAGNSQKNLKDSFKKMEFTLNRSKEKGEDAFDKWIPKFKEKKEKYEDALREMGGDKRKLEGERKELENKRDTSRKKLDKFSKEIKQYSEILKERNKLLDELEKVHMEFYDTRMKKFDELTEKSDGKLRLELVQSANWNAFYDELNGLKKGSKIRDVDIRKYVSKIMPRKFVDLVLEKDHKKLASIADVTEKNAKRIIDVLNLKDSFEDVLALQHRYYPEDLPSINFCKEDSEYYKLNELSVGQKCSALIIIALTEGRIPIIIDQPEDSLDISSVYSDVTLKLRSQKEKRQFILTTHNSSVAVASDSDKFVIIKSTANSGEIVCVGALDNVPVKDEVIEHLEGGNDPYKLRNKKYNIKEA